MDAFRVELVLGFLLLVFFGVPLLVVRLLERANRRRDGAPGAAAPLSVKPGEATGRTCPFCKDAILAGTVHIECATCAAWHHATCFEENQGCAVYGCKERRGLGRASEERRG